MKGKIIRCFVAILALPLIIWASLTFATNQYNIVYEGGTPLGTSNVKTLTGNLVTLVESNNDKVQVEISNSSKWIKDVGYIYNTKGNQNCTRFHYFRIKEGESISSSDGLSFKLTDGKSNKYEIEAQVASVTLESSYSTEEVEEYVVGVSEGEGFLYGGWGNVFQDAQCTNRVKKTGDPNKEINGLWRGGPNKMFIQLKTKLHKRNQTAVFKSNEQFFGLTDIDAAQSYKILNSGNQLSPDNMYAKDISKLQPTDVTLRNMFVTSDSGNYIYSQYSENQDIGLTGDNNIYLELNSNTQTDGLDVVFGFVEAAGSGIEYYTKQYTVAYKPGSHGSIARGAISDEVVFSGDNPTGSSVTANTGYHFNCWKANKNIKLEGSSSTIDAGTCLTPEQVKKVIVNEDITFTANYAIDQIAVNYESDNNGSITGKTSETREYGANPTGSTSSPKEHYHFTYWTADKAVTLKDGTIIQAGEKITPEQVKQVVVSEDITFTAVHALVPVPAPNTGRSTGEFNANQITASVFGVIIGAIFVILPSHLHHKKIGFGKKR